MIFHLDKAVERQLEDSLSVLDSFPGGLVMCPGGLPMMSVVPA